MGRDLLLRKVPDHPFMELSPEPVNTAMDMKARKMVVAGFFYTYKYIFYVTYVLKLC